MHGADAWMPVGRGGRRVGGVSGSMAAGGGHGLAGGRGGAYVCTRACMRRATKRHHRRTRASEIGERHGIRPATAARMRARCKDLNDRGGRGGCGPLGACAALCISRGARGVGGSNVGVMWAQALGMRSTTTPTIASTHAGCKQVKAPALAFCTSNVSKNIVPTWYFLNGAKCVSRALEPLSTLPWKCGK